jgi:outer membrane protein TolC
VQAANDSVRLGDRELALSRDRFEAGLGDNIEVINAETALTDARNQQVSALADFNRSRINLAAALGHAQTFNLTEK